MSDDRKHWYRRVRDILYFIEKLEKILKGKNRNNLETDEVLYFALERLLQNIGEASIHLPDEIKAEAQHIPWIDIANMRHILVHGYDVVEPQILWDTATRNVYTLRVFLVTVKGDELS